MAHRRLPADVVGLEGAWIMEMAHGPQRWLPQQCPRCAGAMYYELEEAGCLFCGERVFATRLVAYPLTLSRACQGEPPQRGGQRKLRWRVE